MTSASEYFLANCKLSFKCNRTWEILGKTKNSKIRHCTVCGEDVFYCTSKQEIVSALSNNKCIAIYIPEENYESQLMGQIISK